MKKVFTLLLAMGCLTAVFAQSGRNRDGNDQWNSHGNYGQTGNSNRGQHMNNYDRPGNRDYSYNYDFNNRPYNREGDRRIEERRYRYERFNSHRRGGFWFLRNHRRVWEY